MAYATIYSISHFTKSLLTYSNLCRYQCLPLYKVEYNKLVYGSNGTGKIDFPELCWKANDQNENPLPSPIRLRTENWPFYAEKLFAQMY